MFAYKEHGSPSNRALVFFHGFLGSNSDWNGMIEHLQDHFHCITVDLPGHGKTPFIQNWDFFQLAKTISDFLADLKISKPVLIGYSMGGRIAHFTQKHHLQNDLSICIGSHLGIEDSKEINKRNVWRLKWEELLLKEDMSSFIDQWYGQEIFSSFRLHKSFPTILEKRIENSASEIRQALSAFCVTKQGILKADEKNIFLIGSEDHKYCNLYKKHKCRFHIIPNAGHVVHLENPQFTANKIKEVIDGLEDRKKL